MDCVSVRLCLRAGYTVYCAETAEPIEMPFTELTHVGPMNHVLDGVKIGRIHP